MSSKYKNRNGLNESNEQVSVRERYDDSGAAYTAEVGVASQRHNRYVTTIGYAAGVIQSATWTLSQNVRRYRCKPSADMRVIEDAANIDQAEIWLNAGAARAASASIDVEYVDLASGEWSEWQEMSKDPDDLSITSLWFSLDAAGTGATVVIEAE